MFDASLAELQRRIRESPGDPEAWVALARHAERTDRTPGFLEPARDAAALEALLERYPERRDLARLWARLVGLALVPPGDAPPGSEWRRSRRLGTAEDHLYDTLTGRPLRLACPHLGLTFAWIPPGEYWMGSPEDDPRGLAQERPRHTVAIPVGFYLATTPVTRGQFARVLDTRPWSRRGGEDELPATGVRWMHAAEYCARAAEGWGPRRAGYALRLPSEAEWEYAARARRDEATAAEDVEREAWHAGNAPKGPRPVGGRTPNPWGLSDMIGNVWEWVLDRFHPGYVGAPADGGPRLDPAEDDDEEAVGRRTLRGGSVEQAAEELSVTMRKAREAHLHTPHTTCGMRPALSRRAFEAEAEVAARLQLPTGIALEQLRSLAEVPPDEPLDEDTVELFERLVRHFRDRQDPRCVVPLLEVFRGPPDPGAEPASLLDPGDVTPRSEDHVYELIPERVWGAMLYGGILPALEAQPRAEVLRGLRLVLEGSDPALRIRAMDLPFLDPSLADLYRRSLRSEHRDERYLAAEKLRMVMGPADLAAVREAYEDEPSEAVRAVLEEILDDHSAGEGP